MYCNRTQRLGNIDSLLSLSLSLSLSLGLLLTVFVVYQGKEATQDLVTSCCIGSQSYDRATFH
jgi:hypothetical protein